MRLVNAETMTVEDFWNEVPVYTILSHTWGDEEVTLQEMNARMTQPSVERKRGYIKIKKACSQALLDGFSYVWIDTCCIDKTSSSELSEAINSMFRWYQEAAVCYAYLVDVSASENAFDINSQFRKCKWFTRGWTLQELIAPLSLVFYDKDWVEIGTKSSLRKVITQVTNISRQVLLANHSGEISIAARMSWAAHRQTTKVEDMAYCLLGLFGINMPIFYGEGENAFIRLQREIIATSDDHSIFAWIGGHGGAGAAGLLAKSPADFAQSSRLSHRKVDNRLPYKLTNVGLSIELPLQPVRENANQFKALLNCVKDDTSMCGIYLNKDEEGQYVRTRSGEMFTDTLENQQQYKREQIYIKEPVPSRFDVVQWMRPRTNYQFLLRTLPDSQIDGFAATEFYPNSSNHANWSQLPNAEGALHQRLENPGFVTRFWPSRSSLALPPRPTAYPLLTLSHSGISGAILFESQSGQYERFVVMLGMHNYNVWCDIVTDIPQSDKLEMVAESYYKDDSDGAMLWENRDRLCKQLTGCDKYIFAAIRKGILKSGDQYLVDITVTTDKPPNASASGFGDLDIVMPQAAYQFHVIFDHHAWEPVELTAFDSIVWHHRKDQSLSLALKNSGVSGIMVLRDRDNDVRVAVLLGVHNYKPWSDVIANIKSDVGAAREIRDSYYVDGPGTSRDHRLWAWDTDVEVQFAENHSVRVTTEPTGPEGDLFVTNIVRG